MFSRHSRTLRHAVWQYKVGTTGKKETPQPIQLPRAYRPPENDLLEALRKLIARYTELRNAKRLPCQLLWNFVSRGGSKSRKTIQGTRHMLDTRPTAVKRFPSTHPNKDTKDTGLLTAKPRGMQVQEEDAGDAQEIRKYVQDAEDIVKACATAERIACGIEELKDVEKDMENVEEVRNFERCTEDVEGVEIGVQKDANSIEQDEDRCEKVEDGKRGTKEAEHVEAGVERGVEDDVGGDIGDAEDFTQEGFEEIEERCSDERSSRVWIDEKNIKESRRIGVYPDNPVYTGTEYPSDLANTIEEFQVRETDATGHQKDEPPQDGRLQTEPVQSVPTALNTTDIQAIPTSEDIRTLLSQLATATVHRPRRTALGTRNFTNYVLNPRGIRIDTDEVEPESAFEHFKSVEPPPGSNAYKHYTQISGLQSSTLWINPTDDAIQSIHSNYSQMHQSVPNALCEPEWVDDAVRFLLKSEPRRKLQPKLGSPSQWLPVRMREESFRPQDGGVWNMPPIIHEDVPVDLTFNFNVHPDCSYWIWTGGFRPEINGGLTSLASDTKHSSKGRQQIAVAASTALYNRWRLRESYLRKSGVPFDRERFSDVRHYGLLLAGVRYEVWCLRPHNITDTSHFSMKSWTGCGMQKIHSGDLDTYTGIKDCINWINEIHCWGNTRHSSGCARDIESRLLPEEKMLTSTMAQLELVKRDEL